MLAPEFICRLLIWSLKQYLPLKAVGTVSLVSEGSDALVRLLKKERSVFPGAALRNDARQLRRERKDRRGADFNTDKK